MDEMRDLETALGELGRRVAELEAHAASTADLLADLTMQLTARPASPGATSPGSSGSSGGDSEEAAPAPTWDFATMDATQARQAWDTLTRWVDEVLVMTEPRTYLGGRSQDAYLLEPCWWKHPDVVADLAMLYGVWYHGHHGPHASAPAVAEYRDRWLPGALSRMQKAMERCKTLEHHEPTRGYSGNDKRAPLVAEDMRSERAAHIRADLDKRATTPPPGADSADQVDPAALSAGQLDTAAYAVISPAGDVTWYPATAETRVREIIGGPHKAVGLYSLPGVMALLASDVFATYPSLYAANGAAREVVDTLSAGRRYSDVTWGGPIAVFQLEPHPERDGLGGVTVMSPQYRDLITRAVTSWQRAQPGAAGESR